MPYNYSIIVPYRDKYKLFVKAIDSIPDRKDIQIIIVDNAPQSLLKEQIPQKNHITVTYITSSPTKGAGHARNVGMEYAEGEYIIFLDSDDFFTDIAFGCFDTYLDKDYDLIVFNATSICIPDGTASLRHKHIEDRINEYLIDGSEDPIRYLIVTPYPKMIRRELITHYNLKFMEVPASNDLLFSVKVGHFARKICVSDKIVYVITEGTANSSLTKSPTRENMWSRYNVAMEQYKFMESIGRKDLRFHVAPMILFSLKKFGVKEFFKYIKYALKNKINIFLR